METQILPLADSFGYLTGSDIPTISVRFDHEETDIYCAETNLLVVNLPRESILFCLRGVGFSRNHDPNTPGSGKSPQPLTTADRHPLT